MPRRHHALLRSLLAPRDAATRHADPADHAHQNGGSPAISGRDDGSPAISGRDDGSPAISGGGGGTLLVCPLAARVRGADLLRDFGFDGLALAFLKNLQDGP